MLMGVSFSLLMCHMSVYNEAQGLVKFNSAILDLKVKVKVKVTAQSYPTLCDPMNRSMPGHPVHRQLPESTQTHIH